MDITGDRILPWLYNCAFPVVTMEEQNGLGFVSPIGWFEPTSYTMRLRLFAVKANANREQNLPSLLGQLCRDVALLIQRRKDGSCVSVISFNPSSSFPSFPFV